MHFDPLNHLLPGLDVWVLHVDSADTKLLVPKALFVVRRHIMLSGASRDRPVIVGWSTALRGQVINESLGQLPKKLAAGPRLLARTESSRSESGTKQGGPPHDHWAKLGQLRYTRSQYSFVAIALFARVY